MTNPSAPKWATVSLNETPDDRFHRALLDNVHPPAWRNPKPAEKYTLIVIGAGPGGLTAASEAVALGAKVALIERDLIGGDRLNVGCVPSKAIIRTARLYAEMRDANNFGGQVPSNISIDFAAIMERMRRIQAHLGRGASAPQLSEAGVDVFWRGPLRGTRHSLGGRRNAAV